MKVNYYAVFDTLAQLHLRPFGEVNNAVALRNFADSLKSDKNPVALHPENYTLQFLGVWDMQTGVFENVARPQTLATASSLLTNPG